MEVRDPVCGMQFDDASARAMVRHRDVTYYFCCERCKVAFEHDSDRFLEEGK